MNLLLCSRARIVALVFALLLLPLTAAAQSPAWVPAAPMSIGGWGASATVLNDGRVLVISLRSTSDVRAEIYNPATDTWTLTGSMGGPRGFHEATLLADGRVLITGGEGGSGMTAAAAIYNPATNVWTAAASMPLARSGHSAVRLADGRVMVIGGANSYTGDLNTTVIYTPATNTWANGPSTSYRRGMSEAVVLNDGRVLVAGSFDGNEAEIYDPATGTWALTGPAPVSPAGMTTLTALADGRALLAGGAANAGGPWTAQANAAVFTPATNSWTATPSMSSARREHTAVRLADGRVILVGGTGAADVRLATTDLYDPFNNVWTPGPSLSTPRLYPGLALLNNGFAFAAAGLAANNSTLTSSELFDPASVFIPPTASAGPDQTVQTCFGCTATITLDGSGSQGHNSLPLSYQWRKNGLLVASSSDPTSTATLELPVGVHTFTLTVSDTRGSTSDAVTINVQEPPPVAPTPNAGVDQTLTACFGCNATATLDASASSGNNGQPLTTFTWKEGAATIASGVSPTVSLAKGVHTITLTVSDGLLSASDTVVITVNAPNAPTVNAGPDQTIQVCFGCNATVTLTGAGSAGNNSEPITYTWKDGTTALAAPSSSPTLSVVLTPGVHTITLTVADGVSSGTDTVIVNINPTLVSPPTVSAGPDQTRNGCTGCQTPVTLDATGSIGRNGLPLTYTWRVGATVVGTSADPTKTVTVGFTVGVHTVVLTAADTKAGATDTVIITIVDPSVSLSAQVVALQAQVAALDGEKAALQTQVAALNGDKTALQTQVASLTTANTDLQSQVTTLTSDNATLQGQLALANGQLASANQTTAAQASTIAALQADLTDANQTIGSQAGIIAALQGDLAAANQTIGNQAATITGLQGELAVANQTIGDSNAMIAGLNADVAAANATIAARDITISGLDANVAALTNDKTALEGQVSSLGAQLQEALNTVATRDAAIVGLNASITTLTDEKGALQAQVSLLGSQLGAANATIASRDTTITALNAQIADLLAQLAASTSGLEATFQQVFADPAFEIPGTTPEEQVESLVTAIDTLNNGQKQAIYKALGGKKK